jgi:hypothetical protein
VTPLLTLAETRPHLLPKLIFAKIDSSHWARYITKIITRRPD